MNLKPDNYNCTMQTVRIRQIAVPPSTENNLVLQIRSSARVADLQKLIRKKLDIIEKHQKLYYGGKELLSDQEVASYRINDHDVIQLMIKSWQEDEYKKDNENIRSSCNLLVGGTSKYYKIGDLIDVIYKELGAWFEAKIVGIFVDQENENAAEDDLIFQVVMDREEQTAPINVKFVDIRPRAIFTYKKTELETDMVVFVNYNIQKPKERGYWYDFKVVKVNKNTVEGILMLGTSLEDIDNCIIKFIDEVMKIEKPTILNERAADLKETLPLRKLPLYCKKCKDVSLKDCRECSCNTCGKKNFIDKLIICDECADTYHLFCLIPPLVEVPLDPEWYCPHCKTDENEIVKAGEKLKTSQNKKYAKSSEIRIKRTFLKKSFGPVFGVCVGTSWNFRSEVFESGVHGTPRGEIDSEDEGVYSIVLDGEHEIYEDNGDEFYYTISGPDSVSNRQTISTKLTLPHSAKIKRLTLNCGKDNTENCFGKADFWKCGKPIRITRSSNMISSLAPKTGFRYDGTYKVVEYFPVFDTPGRLAWRFLLKRDDSTPPPWSKKNEKSNLDGSEMNLQNPNKKLKLEVFHLDENIMKFIDDDLVNAKMWYECKETVEQGREKFIEKVKELFKCVCCQDILYLPVTTECKHNICFECLKKCFIADIYHCPSCRLELDKKILIQVNRNLDSALKLIFSG